MRIRFYVFTLCLLLIVMPAQAKPFKYITMPSQFTASAQITERDDDQRSDSFGSATGDFSFDPDNQTMHKLRISLATKTLSRRFQTLFAAYQHPEITFISNGTSPFKDSKADIKGTLNVRGISRPATLKAVLVKISENKKQATLSLKTDFKRNDFGIADSDFKEEITLILEMNAVSWRKF